MLEKVTHFIVLREAFKKKKKTAKIVTSSLSGGKRVSLNPYKKTNYYRDITLWRGGVQTLNSLL